MLPVRSNYLGQFLQNPNCTDRTCPGLAVEITREQPTSPHRMKAGQAPQPFATLPTAATVDFFWGSGSATINGDGVTVTILLGV